MTTSLHHAKAPSELPQIPRYSPERTKLLLRNFNPLKEIQSKNPFSQILSKDSTAYPESSSQHNQTKSQINHSAKETQFMKNSYNPKGQTTSLGLGCPNMLQKMLQKNKKYVRVDAHLKTQNNVIKNDIESLIETLVQEKQKNDFILVNLRDKFQTNKRSLTLNKRNPTLQRTNQRNSTRIASQQPGTTCPIALVNHFTQSRGNNLKNRKNVKEEYNTQQFMTTSCLMNTEIKNFKQIMKQYIHTYRLSMNQESQMKNSSMFGMNENMTSTFGSKSGNWEGKKEDQSMGNMGKGKNSNKKPGNLYFKEFIQLTQKSQDYLEYYLKSSFVTQFTASRFHNDQVNERNSLVLNQTRQQIDKMLKHMDKNAILSVLRSSSKCLQPAHNQKEIVNRILLALNINPMNEFHFIKQQTFTKFKKLMTGQASRKESRQFLLKYFCMDCLEVKKCHFDNLLYCVLNKLLPILNDSTVEILYEKAKKICQQTIMLIRAQSQNEAKNNQNNKENNSKSIKLKSNFQPNRLSQENEKDETIKQSKNQRITHGKNRPSVAQCYYKRQQIKSMLFQDPFNMWDEILQLIFTV